MMQGSIWTRHMKIENVTQLQILPVKKSENAKNSHKIDSFFQICEALGPLPLSFCLFVLGFYGPVNNVVMLSWPVNSGTVPQQA